jgi:hypothetical protein
VAPGLALLGHHASETSEREEIGEEKRAVGSGQAR